MLVLQPNDALRVHYTYDMKAGEYYFEYLERIKNMDTVQAVEGYPGSIQLTIQQRLESEKEKLEKRLKQVNEGLEALDKNPEVKEVINKLSAITHF